MATEFTDKDNMDVEGFEDAPSGGQTVSGQRPPSGEIVQPLRLLEARINEVQSRWHAVEEQLTHKDRTIAGLRADLEDRSTIIKRLETTLADSMLAKGSADDASAATQAELSHLEAQLIQQSEMLNSYQEKLVTATRQYEELLQELDNAHEEIEELRADLTRRVETGPDEAADVAASFTPTSLTPEETVEHAVKHLEHYLQAPQEDDPGQNDKLFAYADALADLEQRIQEQEALLRDRDAAREALDAMNLELQARCGDRDATILTLEQKLDRRIEELETVRTAAAKFQDATEDLEETIATQVEQIEELEAGIARREKVIAELEEALDSESRFSADLEGQLEQQTQRVRDAEAQLSGKMDSARALESQLVSLQERVTTAEAQLATRTAKVDSLERTLQGTGEALKAATENLERAVADADGLKGELTEARALNLELEHTVAMTRLDRGVFEAELGAQQLLISELEQDLQSQQHTVALLDSSVERITTIAASLETLDKKMAFSEEEAAVEHVVLSSDVPGPHPCLMTDGNTFLLDKPVVTIGRSKKNDIHLQSLFTSRFHARFLVRPSGEVIIEDLGSRNGVRVNSEKATRQKLRDGDRIWIGERELTFLLPDTATAVEDA